MWVISTKKILGNIKGATDLNVGDKSGVDIECKEKKIIAEIKNKHNTVTGVKLSDQYYALRDLVGKKYSPYKDYTAYFVNIIPSKPERINKPFTPSDSKEGAKCPINEKIRIIDGASFYSLLTGEENALEDLYKILPQVIEKVMLDNHSFKIDLSSDPNFSQFYEIAYKKK